MSAPTIVGQVVDAAAKTTGRRLRELRELVSHVVPLPPRIFAFTHRVEKSSLKPLNALAIVLDDGVQLT